MSEQTSEHTHTSAEGATGPDLRATAPGVRGTSGRLSADDAKGMLEDAAKLLWQVCTLTSSVLETVRVQDVRKMVVGDLPGVEGTVTDDAPAPEAAAATNPSAQTFSNPLAALIRMGMQAARLMREVLRMTHWHSLNQKPEMLKMQLSMAKMKASLKKAQGSGAFAR